jgi:alkaline phosphatase
MSTNFPVDKRIWNHVIVPVSVCFFILAARPAYVFAQTAATSSAIVLTQNAIAQTEVGDEGPLADEAATSNDGELDAMAQLQLTAATDKTADWGHWGNVATSYMGWTNHSNRLVPIYVYGGSFSDYTGEKSLYRDEKRVTEVFGKLPKNTVNSDANYADQTDIYQLQKTAVASGKKNIFVIVFDGMDWQTTQAAALYAKGDTGYTEGRGTGLAILDYKKVASDFGSVVTSPYADGRDTDVNTQTYIGNSPQLFGGYDLNLGGAAPWMAPNDVQYPIGRSKVSEHAVTDSASSATSITTGKKAINGAINVDPDSQQLVPIARELQAQGWSVGVVTSVPFCHATPAAAYANNVSRSDYQDLGRDMLGVASVAHRSEALSGMDVVIGCGWDQSSDSDRGQGENFIAGNKYLAGDVLGEIDVDSGGTYVVAQRTPGKRGGAVLNQASRKAAKTGRRLFGFFGVDGGHLPFRTANGDFKPVQDVKAAESYSEADVSENPTLTQMTNAALTVLESNDKGFWLMIEAGDVDWANHADNVDNSIGAVLSGDNAFRRVTRWIEENNAWDDSLVIVTADHGHYLNVTNPDVIAEAGRENRAERKKIRDAKAAQQ